jgi:hypothetical protein
VGLIEVRASWPGHPRIYRVASIYYHRPKSSTTGYFLRIYQQNKDLALRFTYTFVQTTSYKTSTTGKEPERTHALADKPLTITPCCIL